MTIEEITARLFSPHWPLTAERFLKAKALVLRSKRPTAFLELLAAVPTVSHEMVEEAHKLRLSHLRTALVIMHARLVKDDPQALAEHARSIAHLEHAMEEETATHLQWKESINASENSQAQSAETGQPESPAPTRKRRTRQAAPG
jgi:hypothetical protein